MSEKKFKNCETNQTECPVKEVLSRIGDKWTMLTVITLNDRGTLRFNELHQLIENISQKMLTVTLKTLESDGLVSRKMYPQIPPKVEYALTPLGESLVPALLLLYDWANTYMQEIKLARKRYDKAITSGRSSVITK